MQWRRILRLRWLSFRATEPGIGRQGSDYLPGVSAETVGAEALWLGIVTIPPGGRTKAHVHARHKSAFYMMSGTGVEMWSGEDLKQRELRPPRRLPFHPDQYTARRRQSWRPAGRLHRLPERADRAGKRRAPPRTRREGALMPAYRSRTTTHGRNMAGARGLWRATGMTDADFGKPIIAVVNSFTQFVPGHVHLKDLGQLVAREIETAGGVAKEFNTIAVDDGIAMGHDGMLYSLPSRELIADSVEYMVNAHCADAMVCISNCDKITPGMLMAAMRLNIPAVFVSGGPMEAGKVQSVGRCGEVRRPDRHHGGGGRRPLADADVKAYEQNACPTCGSCSGMFTANSMNCLTEALGLSLPGNGSTLATHADRKRLFQEAGHLIVDLAQRYYEQDDDNGAAAQDRQQGRVRKRHDARHRHGRLDQHRAPHSGRRPRRRHRLHHGRHRPAVAPGAGACARSRRQVPDVHMEDVHRAGGIMAILGELDRGGLIHRDQPTVHAPTLGDALDRWDVVAHQLRQRAGILSWRRRRRADADRLQPVGPLGRTRPRPAKRAPSARSAMPSPRMAASRC